MLTGPSFSPASGAIKRVVILLHGYGSDGADMIDIAQYWSKKLPDTLFVAPNAPAACDVNPAGYQWFGLPDFDPLNIRQGLENSAPIVKEYITHLLITHNLTAKDIALVGFSQGAMLSLEMLFHIDNLGSIIGYSGAFFPPLTLQAQPHAPSVLLVHGTNDTVVPYGALLQAQTQLSAYKINVQTLTCPGLTHSINQDGLDAGAQHLKSAFAL